MLNQIEKVIYKVRVSEKLAKQFTLNSGFTRLNKKKEYLRVSGIGQWDRSIYFSGNDWIFKVYKMFNV